MADTAALKLGNLISSKISGTLGSFASGLKGSFIGANPAVFGPMAGILSKGFGSLTKQTQIQAKTQQEQTQRESGFREEADNERKRYEQILLSVQKGMAINIEAIQKDVREILELMKKQGESFWDKILAGLAGLGAAVSAFVDEILKSLKVFVDKIGSVIDDIVKFFKSIPGRISSAINDIIKFLRNIPEMIGRFFEFLKNLPSRISAAINGIIDAIKAIPEKLGKFFSSLIGMFDDFIKKYFPNARAAIGKFFSDLADLLKFDKIKAFFTSQFENLKKIFNFEDAIKAIGTRFNDLAKLLNESEIAKAFRRIRNIFAISFAQYADELEDLFNNKLMKSIGDMKTSIGGLGDRIMSVIDGAVDSLRSSRLVTFGEEFGGKIMSFFDGAVTSAKSTKLGTLADDILKVGVGIFTDIGTLLKTGLGAVTPDVSDLKTFFTLGKESLNLDELRFVMGEGGVIQKGVTLIGKFVGDIGRIFAPIGEFFKGESFLGKIAGFDDLVRLMGRFGKIAAKGLKAVPVLGEIIMVIEGLFAAFDTDQIASDLNKQVGDVNWKDRLSALFGGIIGSLGGLGDLVLMAINGVFDTNFKTEGPESIQSRVTSYFTQFFSDVGSIIGSSFTLLKGLITFDKGTIDRAAGDIGRVFDNIIGDLADVFSRYVTDPAKQLYNIGVGFIERASNWVVDSINKLIGMAIDALPTSFTTKWGTVELVSQETKDSWKQSLSLGKVDLSSIKADETPSVMGTGKDQSAAETARLGRGQKTATEGIAKETASRKAGEETLKRAGVKPSESAGGGRGSSPGSMGYTAADLKSMGINVRDYGDVQKSGAYIAGSTIEGAKKTQSLVRGITFTGFNDDYHDKHSPASSHRKGLAFDFTVPPSAAMDNGYRKEIAQAISSTTGAKVIDEYAFPSAKSTGGHFHVDFTGAKGVDLGTGYFGGEKTEPNVNAPQPRGMGPQTPPPSREDTSPTLYERVNRETGEKYYTDVSGNAVPNAQAGTTPAQRAGAPTMPGQPQVRVIVQPKILSAEEALDYAQRIAYYDAEKKRYDEEKKYRDERARLENKFYGDLESMVRPMVTALQGPAGSMDPALAKDAGKNLAAGMQADFTKLGTTLFGKQYGAAMGTTFQQLAGSYLDQFINQALAPAMGVDAEVLNRSINLYAKGKEFASKTLAPAQKALDDAKTALQAKEKEVGISKASIIRASGLGKSLSADQLSKIAQLETMRKGVTEQESKVNALKKQRKQYNQVALEDMFFGMTGVPTGPRSLIEQYGGADALTRDLATMIGAPFSPAFHLGEKGPLAGPGVDPRIALDQRLKQTENVIVESGQVVSVKAAEGVVQGATQGAEVMQAAIENGGRAAASSMAGAIENSRVPSFGAGGVSTTMGDFVGAVSDGVASAFGDILPTVMDFDQVAAGGGTAIPGYVESDRETAKFLRQAGAGGVGMMAGEPSRLPVNTGKLMDFGQNMLYNMLGSKVSSAVGGGMGGNILGRAAQGALKGAFSGGDIVQNIGAQFGMKLAPGAGFGDLFGAFNSMANSPFAGIAKTGMNMMQSLMPGGATGPMGQFGFDFFSGMGSGGNFMSNLGSAMSSGGSFMGSFGANAAGTGMNLGNFAGQAAGALGPIMQGMQYGDMAKKLIGGQYQVSKGLDTFYKAGSAVASAIMGPIGGALVGAVSGGINRLFGRKPKETKAEGFSGTFSTEGADVKQFSDWFQKGGVFRSDKRGTTMSAVDAETSKAFSDTVKDTTKTVESLGKVLGYDPTKTKGFSKAVKIDLKGLNEKQQQEAIQKAFKDYGASLVGSSFKMVGKFTKTGEDQLDTLSRLADASETFKSVMTGPDVKKILGLDNADMIKNLVGPQFAGITNMDAAIKDYLGGGKGMMETGIERIGIPGLFGGKDGKGGWFRSDKTVTEDGIGIEHAALNTAFTNAFSKLNLDPVSDVAQNIISAFTGSLQDQAGSLQEYLNTYIADFQSQLIEAYGGAEEFKRIESSLFDLLYTEEEKKAKLQELTAAQMKEAAQNLKDAGVAIDPDKLGATFADNQKAAKDMLTTADKDLALGKITKEQFASIRKSALTFLDASKKNSELGGVAGAARKPVTAEDVTKLMYPVQTAVASGTKSIAQTSADAANTIATASVSGSDNIAASTLSTANTVSSTTLATANTISTGLSSYNTALEQLITNFYNSSQVFNGSILTLNTSISELSGGVGGLGGSVDGVSTSVGSVSEGLSSAVSAAAAAVSAAVSAVSDAVSDAVSAATSAVSAAVSAVSDAVSDAVSSNAIGDAAAEGGNTAASAAAAAASATAAGDDGSASDGGAGGGGGGGGGDGGASGCVDPEVPLYISSTETKSAGDVVIGDYMYTVHEKTLEYGMYKVINAQIIIQDKIIVTFDDDTTMKISTTHKFLLNDGSWKEMYLLDVGAQIQTMHGVNERGYKTITRIEDIGDGEVVLLTVEDAHTYIADGLISHNMKARGGSVRKTKSYIVGEVGPEIFVPNMAGTIIPTHRIIEAVQNASALDTQTRNLLMNAAPAPNPISMAYLAQEQSKKSLDNERSSVGAVNNAVVDNSVTQVSSPQTTVINGSGDVRSSHPISGMFTRNMIGARGF